MKSRDDASHIRWARFRFSVIGPLLAAPPPRGQLAAEIGRLSQKTWRHPITGEPVCFGFSTLERWYYTARNAPQDPVGRLRRKVRKDAGQQPSLSDGLRRILVAQYRAHPAWSAKLHADNLVVIAHQEPRLGPAPSYDSVRRYLKAQGLVRQRRLRGPHAPRVRAKEGREVRSFEAEYVLALWHLDFHHGSRKVLLPDGSWHTPILLGVLDDCSRLAPHLQWYLDETAQTLVHGLCQGIQKRGLPRALMTDHGPAMLAAETVAGLERLGIVHETTLPYSPYQNAKQEVLWATIEGRLLAMLEGVEELSLSLLNEATHAWLEGEYHPQRHSELGMSPWARYRAGPDVGRESPSSEALRRAFRAEVTRTQRKSDGTITLEGRRFEIPSRYRQLEQVRVRYARWDLRAVDLVDPHMDHILATLHPQDKARNADARRRVLEPLPPAPTSSVASSGMAPLLRHLMAEFAATGRPPAYLPTEPVESPRPGDPHQENPS